MKFVKQILVALSITLTIGTYAAPWAAHGPKDEPKTLIVTGNYQSPRLIAELIQNEGRHPILLLPAYETGDTRIIHMQPKQALQIPAHRLDAWIRACKVTRLIILGDNNYIQQKYLDSIDKSIPRIQVTGSDWNRIAYELTDLLNLSNLGVDYARLRPQIDERRKNAQPRQQMEQQPMEEEVVATEEETTPEETELQEITTEQEIAAPVEESQN